MIAYTFNVPDFWVGVVVGLLAGIAMMIVLAVAMRDRT